MLEVAWPTKVPGLFPADFIEGRPTKDGKIAWGKFVPLNPHLTY